jgi:hypothetical protein
LFDIRYLKKQESKLLVIDETAANVEHVEEYVKNETTDELM